MTAWYSAVLPAHAFYTCSTYRSPTDPPWEPMGTVCWDCEYGSGWAPHTSPAYKTRTYTLPRTHTHTLRRCAAAVLHLYLPRALPPHLPFTLHAYHTCTHHTHTYAPHCTYTTPHAHTHTATPHHCSTCLHHHTVLPLTCPPAHHLLHLYALPHIRSPLRARTPGTHILQPTYLRKMPLDHLRCCTLTTYLAARVQLHTCAFLHALPALLRALHCLHCLQQQHNLLPLATTTALHTTPTPLPHHHLHTHTQEQWVGMLTPWWWACPASLQCLFYLPHHTAQLHPVLFIIQNIAWLLYIATFKRHRWR